MAKNSNVNYCNSIKRCSCGNMMGVDSNVGILVGSIIAKQIAFACTDCGAEYAYDQTMGIRIVDTVRHLTAAERSYGDDYSALCQ
jgi:hypothetical protein